jgi:hypothetical protein
MALRSKRTSKPVDRLIDRQSAEVNLLRRRDVTAKLNQLNETANKTVSKSTKKKRKTTGKFDEEKSSPSSLKSQSQKSSKSQRSKNRIPSPTRGKKASSTIRDPSQPLEHTSSLDTDETKIAETKIAVDPDHKAILRRLFLRDFFLTDNCARQIFKTVSTLLKRLIGDVSSTESRKLLLENVLSGGLLTYGIALVEEKLNQPDDTLSLSHEDMSLLVGDSISYDEYQYRFLALIAQYILEELRELIDHATGICGDVLGFRHLKILVDGLGRSIPKNSTESEIGNPHEGQEEAEESQQSTVPIHYCNFVEFLDEDFSRIFVPIEHLETEDKRSTYVSTLRAADDEYQLYCGEIFDQLPLQVYPLPLPLS